MSGKLIAVLITVAMAATLAINPSSTGNVAINNTDNKTGNIVEEQLAENIKVFKTFDEYVSYMKGLNIEQKIDTSSMGRGMMDGADMEKAAEAPTAQAPAMSESESITADAAADDAEFGETNVQVAGVDEADIIKNDGRYIYIMNRNSQTIKLVDCADSKNLKIAATIKLKTGGNNSFLNYNDIYVHDDKLVVIYGNHLYQTTNQPATFQAKLAIGYFNDGKQLTGVDIYDLSDKSDIRLVNSLSVEGNLSSTRMIGNTLYVISNKYINMCSSKDYSPYTEENLLVSYNDGASEEMKYIDVSDMYCIEDENNPYNAQNMNIIAAIDVNNAENMSVKSFIGSGYDVYMSLDNLYVFSECWENDKSYTNIYKYNIDNTSISYEANGKAEGTMINQFCADEYNDTFRIATTTWDSGNNVYVFDSEMNQTGSITGIAKGEQIKSVRFMGEKGYVVTYRNMDPLFSLDLSDASNPKITGELKIPGFSSYLHPVSDNLIIGVGEATTPIYWVDENGNQVEDGVKQIGTKVSLFDVSNPAKPVEIKSLVIGGPGSYTEIAYDHKSFMDIKSKEMFAIRGEFTPKRTGENDGYIYKPQAILLSYENDTLNIEKVFDGENSYDTGNRITYINDTLFHLTGTEIVSYSFDNYQKLGSVKYDDLVEYNYPTDIYPMEEPAVME